MNGVNEIGIYWKMYKDSWLEKILKKVKFNGSKSSDDRPVLDQNRP